MVYGVTNTQALRDSIKYKWNKQFCRNSMLQELIYVEFYKNLENVYSLIKKRIFDKNWMYGILWRKQLISKY